MTKLYVAHAKVYTVKKGDTIYKNGTVIFHDPGGSCVPGSRLRRISKAIFTAVVAEGTGKRCPECWTTRRWNLAIRKKTIKVRKPALPKQPKNGDALKPITERILEPPDYSLDAWMNATD